MAANDDLLFAEHAVKAGYLTEEDVQESLGVQSRMAEMGVPDTLRSILVKRGVLREGDAALVARAAGLRSGREPIPGYTLEARIGSGAMGSVYRAHQRGMKRHVAIKILRRDLTDDPRQVERLQREAALVGRLDHPNIVRGLDSGETDGLIWFVMELVDGRTLRQRMREDGPIPVDEAVQITRDLADALRHANEHGIVHRDIKPGNILLTKDDEPRLSDYGLAKGESDDALTQLDATLGTPQYISPEQARNPRDADIRSDLYSLGATLYAMLAGRPPFQADTLAATLTKVLYEQPEPIGEAAPGTPPEVVYVVQRMMAKDRRYRYPDPAALLRDLDALVRGKLHVPAGFEGDIESFVATRRKRRVIVGTVLGVALTAAAVIGGVQWQAAQGQRQTEMVAKGDLEALLVRPGDPKTWTGETVASLISGLEDLRSRHPGTRAAERALAELTRWRRQEAAIARVQGLSLRADREESPAWPTLLDDLRAERERLRADPNASVASARLDNLLEAVEVRRTQAAEVLLGRAEEAAGELSLAAAPGHLTAAARDIRRTVYGAGRPAPVADDADSLAADFEAARARLLAHFGAYDRAAGSGDLARADLQQLETLLFERSLAAEDDAELIALLDALPPEGTRHVAVQLEREARFDDVVTASRRRFEAVRAAATRLAEGGDLVGAEAELARFGRVALTGERLAVESLRREFAAQRTERAATVERLVDETAQAYLDALGRREYGAARDAVRELRAVLAGRTVNASATRFTDAAERLVELIEERVWEALARRLRTGPIDAGLSVGTGIRYQGVKDVRIEGDRLEFVHVGGHRWSGALRDVVTEDVILYSSIGVSEPSGAAVVAALSVVETQRDDDPRETEERLVSVEPLLVRAAREKQLAAVVERIATRRLELIATAQAEIADAEARARDLHDEALRALVEGRYVDAWRQLDSLLNLTRLRGTRYVISRRDEIRADRQRADRGRATARFAERLPGARLLDRGEGRAELVLDFEDPESSRAVRLAAGRHGVESRELVVADLPAVGDDDGDTLLENRLLAWQPWDGVPAHHPRLYPVEIPHPFLPVRAVELSFTYRSESPFFFMVAVHGTAFGVLSCPDVREGGRGVRIWHAESLDRPDEAFGERFRSQFLAREAALLKREADTTYFQFEPGRTYRVRIVRDERDATLYIDGRRVASEEVRSGATGDLAGRILMLSYTSAEVDDVNVSGWLDNSWLRPR